MIATQSDVEKVLQVDFTADPDANVAAAISIAQAMLEIEAGFRFNQPGAAITNYLTGDGSNLLMTPRRPVNESPSPVVVEDGDTLTEGTDYVWDTSGRFLRISGYTYPYPWSVEPQGVAITYLPGWADETAAPQDLRWVCAQAAARFWKSGVAFAALADDDSAVAGVKQETIGGYSVTYRDDIGGGLELLPHEVTIARRYRRTIRSLAT